MLKNVRLGNVANIIMGQSPGSETYNQTGDGLPFYQGNADFGEVYPSVRYYCSEPVKVANKDFVLVSVRAPVGAVNIADQKCCIGRGLAAIEPLDNCSYYKYLYYILKAKSRELNLKGTGSTFKAINRSILYDLEIAYQPLEAQRKIADTLDKASILITLRKKQLEELDNLIKAIFYKMFGDPITNEKRWEIKKLGVIGSLNRGISKNRPRNAPELLGGPYPLIQTGDVANTGLYIKQFKQTYSELGLRQSKMWDKGTLCITIAANIAKTAILDFDACFPDSLVGFQANHNANNVFIYYWFSFFQKILEEQAPTFAQKNINLKILNNLYVIVPPIHLQNQFATIAEKIEEQKTLVQKVLDESQNLFDGLMARFFGE